MSNWKPSSTVVCLKNRAKYLRNIREYFFNKNVLEVETPILSQAATIDPNIESFTTNFTKTRKTYYLRTSPEFAMKRLLAAGCGDIYSLGKVFRNEQQGLLHNPEFSLLEWYRVSFKLADLMNEVTDLLINISSNFNEIIRYSYAEVFHKYLNINPHNISDKKLKQTTFENINISDDLTRNDCLDLLFTHCIQPKLNIDNNKLNGYFIHSYPRQMSDLATVRHCKITNTFIAERFELFINGIEIANGYYELLDAKEQKQRFELAQQKRKANNQLVYPYDNNLIMALEAGMPECSGVAVGIDRLFMLMENKAKINNVLSFDFTIS